MEYEALLRVRNEQVDNIGPWTWIDSDNGAWEGPKRDWETSHKTKYFEHVKEFNCVVQAGGNQGMYPRLLSDRFKMVYTFEPDPLNFYCLTKNCQKDNIVKFQAALGCERQLVTVNRNTMGNVGMHTVSPGGSIPTLQIDDLGLPYLDLICLDTEGYEPNILAGACDAILAFKPVIVCERGGPRCLDFLKQFGYEEVGTSAEDTIYAVP